MLSFNSIMVKPVYIVSFVIISVAQPSSIFLGSSIYSFTFKTPINVRKGIIVPIFAGRVLTLTRKTTASLPSSNR